MDYQAILDTVPTIIYVKDDKDPLAPVFYNKAWYEYTGVLPEDVKYGWEKVVHPQDIPRLRKEIRANVEKGNPYEIEVRILNKDTGRYRWFVARACPLVDETGKELWVGTLIDVHEAKMLLENTTAQYESEIETRTKRIKALEEELKIHQTGTQ